jgi:hypothetical protein
MKSGNRPMPKTGKVDRADHGQIAQKARTDAGKDPRAAKRRPFAQGGRSR